MPQALEISCTEQPAAGLLADPRVLALFEFAPGAPSAGDPRTLVVHHAPWPARPVRELWRVAAGPVEYGREDGVQWSASPDWLFFAVNEPERDGDIATCTLTAYERVTSFLRRRPGWHVQRLWNYLDDVTGGEGDEERYRRFCAGRLQGMAPYFGESFPAATGIGHSSPAGCLQVYGLAARAPGRRIENPRQLSAWRYPRQYGPVPPSFARAMRLPGDAGLAISGTAAIRGHASQHGDDLEAQLEETLANLDSLLEAGAAPGPLGPGSLLKAYVRRAGDLAAVDAWMAARLPEVPRLLLQAGICRRELLVEIDGWDFAVAGGPSAGGPGRPGSVGAVLAGGPA